MSDYQDEKRQCEKLLAAAEMMKKDHRFRMMVDSTVAQAMRDHGQVDPDRADQGAFDIAVAATALLLARIYTEDAEINALRIERDAYRKRAEEALNFGMPRMFVPSPTA